MKKGYIIPPPPPPHFLEIDDASALSLHKKQSSTYQKRHGCRWFQAAASFSSEKLVGVQRTRTYAVQHACGCFLYAPSICIVYFQKTFQDGHGCPCAFVGRVSIPSISKSIYFLFVTKQVKKTISEFLFHTGDRGFQRELTLVVIFLFLRL